MFSIPLFHVLSLDDKRVDSGSNTTTIAGINIRSPTSAVIDAEEINNPREKTCWNEEKSNPTADKKRTAVVETRARDVL